ncbi:hypothetical protein FB45DRAFT_1150311 [Roridomyces roridus]|uniref:Uncharacterized protein n=1 Tax=Roridomyces roridus TaxID=1738132 RepID=A0AAD7BT58_9AGAR|nr:hypothetical protein FB45DRAFT_1150311 [Roridomyces roridus]
MKDPLSALIDAQGLIPQEARSRANRIWNGNWGRVGTMRRETGIPLEPAKINGNELAERFYPKAKYAIPGLRYPHGAANGFWKKHTELKRRPIFTLRRGENDCRIPLVQPLVPKGRPSDIARRIAGRSAKSAKTTRTRAEREIMYGDRASDVSTSVPGPCPSPSVFGRTSSAIPLSLGECFLVVERRSSSAERPLVPLGHIQEGQRDWRTRAVEVEAEAKRGCASVHWVEREAWPDSAA